jgi:hypothetical protein
MSNPFFNNRSYGRRYNTFAHQKFHNNHSHPNHFYRPKPSMNFTDNFVDQPVSFDLQS